MDGSRSAVGGTRAGAARVAADGDTAGGQVEVRPLSRMQQTVARRMSESRATVPDFELRVDVDIGSCVGLREQLRELGAGPLPSLNDMVVEASAARLREFPRVNGAYPRRQRRALCRTSACSASTAAAR